MIIKVLADRISFQDVLIHRKDDHVYRCVKKFYEKKNNVKQYAHWIATFNVGIVFFKQVSKVSDARLVNCLTVLKK